MRIFNNNKYLYVNFFIFWCICLLVREMDIICCIFERELNFFFMRMLYISFIFFIICM